MATTRISFFPLYLREETRKRNLQRLTLAAWKLAHCALWPEQGVHPDAEEIACDYIWAYLEASTDLKRAFIAFVQRIILAQKYGKTHPEAILPEPDVWFVRPGSAGFAGTMDWLARVEHQRKETPDYLAHLETLGRGYYSFSIRPTVIQFNRCREDLLRLQATSLLQLYYNAIVHLDYVRA